MIWQTKNKKTKRREKHGRNCSWAWGKTKTHKMISLCKNIGLLWQEGQGSEIHLGGHRLTVVCSPRRLMRQVIQTFYKNLSPFFEWALIMSGSKKLTIYDTCNFSVKSTLLALETCWDNWLIEVFDSNLNPRWLQKTSEYYLRSINPFEQMVKNSVSCPQVKGLVPRPEFSLLIG